MRTPVEEGRIRVFRKSAPHSSRYGLYWMQASQRAWWNPALEHAIFLSNEHRLPLVVLFVIVPDYPEANLRSFHFMFLGLKEVAHALAERGLTFVVQVGDPVEEVLEMSKEAGFLVLDVEYLRHQRKWQESVIQKAPCPVIQVEGDVVVPTGLLPPKVFGNARSFRSAINPLLPQFLRPLPQMAVKVRLRHPAFPSLASDDLERVLSNLPLDRSVPPVSWPAGTSAARARLEAFLESGISQYHEKRKDPLAEGTSKLSPYLHFGQISPVEVALKVNSLKGPGPQAFLEELVVRRELAINFVLNNPHYDAFFGLPFWAQETLKKHARDARSSPYSLEDLEEGKTEDPLWNAAQRDLKNHGWLHNYLRMYWGKQFIRWFSQPEEAWKAALYFNNKYLLDGRDPSSFAGVGWCFGLHDRPFPERPLFGHVRPMTFKAQWAKFDVAYYIARQESARSGS